MKSTSTQILRQGVSSLLNSAIIEILAGVTDTEKALNLLKQNFTFTHLEIAKNFQDSYGYALAAISSGLAAPENQRGFWQSLFQAKVEGEFSQHLESDYVLPFAQQQGLLDDELSTFRQTAVAQCQQIAKLTLFQADNVRFSETELASFVTASGASSMTDLVLELVQTQQTLDERVKAFLQFEELLGNALLFFLHEQLRKDPRFQTTLAALQREGLIIDVREIKQIVQATENKLNQAVAEKQFGEVAQLGQQLERLQQVDSVTQTHYAEFLDFSQRFADWAQLVNVQLTKVLATLPELQKELGGIKSDTEQILAIVQQLMSRADLSPQVKPRDELTQYSAANLALIKKARQLLQRIPSSNPQYSRAAIGLGSVVSSQGDLKQAEALFIKAYQQASNDEERALSAFNLFQVFIRQHVYDQALSSLQEAIKFNSQRYALHNVHTYSLQRILGAGGMGCVFLAQHRLKKESVVIKCFWETLHGSADTLFQEAFLMAEIAGEYVPQPLDCGFVDLTKQQRGYFISEYIEGAIDGETWLKKHGKLDVQTGIAVGLQIAKGLQLAHDKGIFHLDLKPANILLQRLKTSEVSKTSDVSVKIIDFGLAKVAPSLGQEMATQRSRSGLSLLAQTAVFGTMDYAPPEQQGMMQYGEPSAKSDVYAFGKTLYRFLTGESPQTLDPRCLAEAPELFYVLCDCVKIEPEKRLDLTGLMKGLMELLRPISQPQPPKPETIKQPQPAKPLETPKHGKNEDKERIIREAEKRWAKQKTVQPQKSVEKPISQAQPPKPEPIKQSSKPVEKPIQPEQPRIVQIDKRQWWNQLDGNWKNIFKKAISIDGEPTDSDLENIVNLQELDCSYSGINDLEPLRVLTNLQRLLCQKNKISDLEPLRTLTNLQMLGCWDNPLSDLEPLRALTNLQILNCAWNQISDLESLRALTNLQRLDCHNNQISDLEPLCALTNLQELDCSKNQINDLEPLRALTNLQKLECEYNKISDLEPLRALTNLQLLHFSSNKINDLEPIHALKKLHQLSCEQTKISWWNIRKFKKAVPNCTVIS